MVVKVKEFKASKRDRSTSNENFNLPPLPSMDDNKDMVNHDKGNFSSDNYKSNEKPMSAIGESLNLVLEDFQAEGNGTTIESFNSVDIDMDLNNLNSALGIMAGGS
jgi:hypothetical protein